MLPINENCIGKEVLVRLFNRKENPEQWVRRKLLDIFSDYLRFEHEFSRFSVYAPNNSLPDEFLYSSQREYSMYESQEYKCCRLPDVVYGDEDNFILPDPIPGKEYLVRLPCSSEHQEIWLRCKCCYDLSALSKGIVAFESGNNVIFIAKMTNNMSDEELGKSDFLWMKHLRVPKFCMLPDVAYEDNE